MKATPGGENGEELFITRCSKAYANGPAVITETFCVVLKSVSLTNY